jgi:hypothetical protein
VNVKDMYISFPEEKGLHFQWFFQFSFRLGMQKDGSAFESGVKV